MRRRYRFVVLGYVVMPEHFHLLISEPERGTPSTVIQALKLGFARRVLRRSNPRQATLFESEASGHVWQRRFYDFNLWTKRKRVEKLRYMHRNPVKRGLVEEPGLWRRSSFRYYAYQEPGPVRINDLAWAHHEGAGGVSPDMCSWWCPTSRNPRDVGHPKG